MSSWSVGGVGLEFSLKVGARDMFGIHEHWEGLKGFRGRREIAWRC